MSKTTLSIRVFENEFLLLKMIDYSKLKMNNRSEYGQKAIEEKLVADGLDTPEKIFAKGLMKEKYAKQFDSSNIKIEKEETDPYERLRKRL